MSETWYESLGFSTNPFTIKPAALNNDIFGIQSQPIIEKIGNGETQFVEAPLGMGKTTLLKSIIAKFGGKRKLVYANCIKNECLEVRELLKNATLKGKLFGTMPREMIMMIDEAQSISQEDAQEITDYMQDGRIKSVVFFGTQYKKKQLTDQLNKSLNGNIITIPYMTPDEAVQLVRKRTGNLKLLPDYVIRELYGRAAGNPRRLLQHCEDICRKAAELSIKELTLTDIGILLKTPQTAFKKTKRAAAETAKRTRRKTNKSGKKTAKRSGEISTTVTYSGYNLDDIRTYEEELPKRAQ